MATKTTDQAGAKVVIGDFVRYHGSKAAQCRITLLQVKRIYPDGRMSLADEGAFPFRISGVRPQSVTLDR